MSLAGAAIRSSYNPFVLRHTYLHVPGVGEKRERDLWLRGFTDWEAFRQGHPAGAWRELILTHLDDARAARLLPSREAWRLAREFPGRTLFLDIETTGLSFSGDSVTCVGVSDGTATQAFVRGRDLARFPDALDGVELLVTYNGSSFDLPVLRSAFPGVDFDRFHHIDLRFPLRRLGITGGLKGAERQLGIDRSGALEGVDGFMAVLLWREHRAGSATALDTLLRYCLEDVVNLKPLLAVAYNRLTAGLPFAIAPIEDDARPPIAYAADPELVRGLMHRRAWA
jgi:uncharacterized protein YprB with RNaseH-like and TPR domain